MSRDETLIGRMYGGDAPPPPGRPPTGVVPALWLAGFLLLGGLALGMSITSGGAITLGYADNELVQWGVLHGDETVLAYAEPDGQTDGTAGCVLVNTGHVVRWADRTLAERIDLRAGSLTVLDGQLTATATDGATLRCQVGDQTEAFLRRSRPFVEGSHPQEHPARDARVDGFRRTFGP